MHSQVKEDLGLVPGSSVKVCEPPVQVRTAGSEVPSPHLGVPPSCNLFQTHTGHMTHEGITGWTGGRGLRMGHTATQQPHT